MDVAEGGPPNPSQKSIRQPRAEPVPLGKQRNGGGKGGKGRGKGGGRGRGSSTSGGRGGNNEAASTDSEPAVLASRLRTRHQRSQGHTGTARDHRRCYRDPNGYIGMPSPQHTGTNRGVRPHRRPRAQKKATAPSQERWQLCSVPRKQLPPPPTSVRPMCLPHLRTRHHGKGRGSPPRSSRHRSRRIKERQADRSAAAATAAKGGTAATDQEGTREPAARRAYQQHATRLSRCTGGDVTSFDSRRQRQWSHRTGGGRGRSAVDGRQSTGGRGGGGGRGGAGGRGGVAGSGGPGGKGGGGRGAVAVGSVGGHDEDLGREG